MEKDEAELVREEWGCPNCGERRMDFLALDEDSVTCDTCGYEYEVYA